MSVYIPTAYSSINIELLANNHRCYSCKFSVSKYDFETHILMITIFTIICIYSGKNYV